MNIVKKQAGFIWITR